MRKAQFIVRNNSFSKLIYLALAVMQPLLEWFAAMPMVAVLFLFLARKGILKDEKLVKSLDRIR